MLLYESTTKTAQNLVDEAEILLKDTTNQIWSEAELLQALKQVIRKLYPDIFTPVTDTSLSTSGTTFDYTLPATLDLILAVEVRDGMETSDAFAGVRFHTEWNGTNNILRLFNLYGAALTIKLRGGKRLSVPTALASTLDMSVDTEDLVLTGMKIEAMEMVLLDKGKLNQFAAREQGVTETDVQNMIAKLERDYRKRKDEVATMLIAQVTRI
jgi:hypothetical protein